MTREALRSIPEGTEALRNIRYMPAEAFADIPDPELENAERWLRAAAHSASEGARHIAAILTQRKEAHDEKQRPDPRPSQGPPA